MFFARPQIMKFDKEALLVFLVAAGILFPLFFTISGGIYRVPYTLPDSGGVITTLPLPMSILVCLCLLAWRLRLFLLAWPAVIMIIGTAMALGFSLVLAGDGVTPLNRKVVMTAQVMLPLIGLCVGMTISKQPKAVAWAFMVVLIVIVPFQLWATWYQYEVVNYLADYLYLFTIYSHIQYVPVIFVCAYIYVLYVLWDKNSVALSLLGCLMLLYVARSNQYLAMGALVIGMLGFLVNRVAARFRPGFIALALLMLVGCVTTTVGYAVKHQDTLPSIAKIFAPAFSKFAPLLAGEIPPNVQERLEDWRLFGSRIIETPRAFVVGRPEPMPREIRTSPHNWYLDIAHTFGLVGLLPFTLLISYTIRLLWVNLRDLPGELRWLASIVAFLVLIDSNFKVTLRQPYPGIFAFFLWGMLLQQLHTVRSLKWKRN